MGIWAIIISSVTFSFCIPPMLSHVDHRLSPPQAADCGSLSSSRWPLTSVLHTECRHCSLSLQGALRRAPRSPPPAPCARRASSLRSTGRYTCRCGAVEWGLAVRDVNMMGTRWWCSGVGRFAINSLDSLDLRSTRSINVPRVSKVCRLAGLWP